MKDHLSDAVDAFHCQQMSHAGLSTYTLKPSKTLWHAQGCVFLVFMLDFLPPIFSDLFSQTFA